MITTNKTKKPERTVSKPLIIAAVVLVIAGLGMLIGNKVKQPDPTLTAAPKTGTPSQQVYKASPDKMAREQVIVAKMNAEIAAVKAASTKAPSH